MPRGVHAAPWAQQKISLLVSLLLLMSHPDPYLGHDNGREKGPHITVGLPGLQAVEGKRAPLDACFSSFRNPEWL